MKHLLRVAVLWMTVCGPAWAAPVDRFVYHGPGDLTFTVTADGLSRIEIGGRVLAEGTWSPFNAENWFKDGGSQAVKVGPWTEKTLTVVDDHHARVRKTGGDVVVTTDYVFDGEDVTLSNRVENSNTAEPLNITGFGGLTFNFHTLPQGVMPVQHISYFQAHGVELCHPGYWSPIGGSYATDDQAGVGTSPWNTGLMRTLTLWDYTDWNADKRDMLPSRQLLYFVVSPVAPRGAATFDFRLRVSANRDWKHLLEPYREHFQHTFGPVQYHADYRWIATDYLNESQQAISPTNPYGFHPGFRRIDTPAGAKAFADLVIPALKENNGQGVIVWGQGGDDPRGAMYRPDFDVVPPEVEAHWNVFASRLKDAGLKLGVATRPRDMAVRENWQHDEIISINPDDPGHREMLLRRFKAMMARGCTLFYLDSFGDSFEDVKLMRWLRGQLGPDILTFAEHQCDAILPYTGGYSETTLEGNANPPGYRLWSGMDRWEIYQWLTPGSQMAARLYQVEGTAPATLEGPDQFFFAHHITPLRPLSDLKRLPEVGAAQRGAVTAEGKWVR